MGGGNKTSLGGKILECVIRAMKLRGFGIVKAADLAKSERDMFAEKPRLLVKNYPYTTLYGTQGRREWYIYAPEWTGQLECKFQNTGGSVDEKMVYVTETLRRSGLAGLVVVHGGEYWTCTKRGAAIVRWMKEEAKRIAQESQKSLLVFDLDEFLTWVGKTFK